MVAKWQPSSFIFHPKICVPPRGTRQGAPPPRTPVWDRFRPHGIKWVKSLNFLCTFVYSGHILQVHLFVLQNPLNPFLKYLANLRKAKKNMMMYPRMSF